MDNEIFGWGGGGGGRVSERSGFCTYIFVTILSKPIFFMFNGLLVSLFMKLLYTFSKIGPILHPFFFLCSA